MGYICTYFVSLSYSRSLASLFIICHIFVVVSINLSASFLTKIICCPAFPLLAVQKTCPFCFQKGSFLQDWSRYPFCFFPFPPQTFVFSLWKNLFLFTCAGWDLQRCLDHRSHSRCTQEGAQLQNVFIFHSFSRFPPDWMTWSQHLSPRWEERENVLREHYLVKLPPPLLHRSLRSDSPTMGEWAPSLCVLKTLIT